jgi:carbamoyl-phosphate synthase large subunit
LAAARRWGQPRKAQWRAQIADSRSIRTTAIAQRVNYYTTVAGGRAAVEGMKHLAQLRVYDLQGLHRTLAA